MDRIRQALGLSTISYYGLSYGTVLGTVYADLFPHRVATMVLDGAVDVNASAHPAGRGGGPGGGAVPRSTCSPPASIGSRAHWEPIPGHSSPGLVASLDRPPAAGTRARRRPPGDRRRPGHGHPLRPQRAPVRPVVLPGAGGRRARQRRRQLRTLALDFATDIDGAPLVDPLWAITCNDAAVHPGPVAAGDLARTLSRPLSAGRGPTR